MIRPVRRAFVTGATGHIGGALVRELRTRGTEVVALARPSSPRDAIERLGCAVEVVEGDVLDPRILHRCISGCDVIFHNAASFDLSPRDPASLRRVAIDGTRNAIAAAAAANPRARVVFTGSVSSVGGADTASTLLDEETWASSLTVPYYCAKQASEREAERLGRELGVDVIRVLPTLVLGPDDHRVTPSSRLLVDMLLGRGATFDGGLNVVDVRDVATAMVAAAIHGRPGSRYIIGAENLLLRDFGGLVSRISRRPIRHVTLPSWAMMGVAFALELGAGLAGKTPALTRDIVRDVYGRYAFYDTARARTELGLACRSVTSTLQDAVAFFQSRGVVPSFDAAFAGAHP